MDSVQDKCEYLHSAISYMSISKETTIQAVIMTQYYAWSVLPMQWDTIVYEGVYHGGKLTPRSKVPMVTMRTTLMAKTNSSVKANVMYKQLCMGVKTVF